MEAITATWLEDFLIDGGILALHRCTVAETRLEHLRTLWGCERMLAALAGRIRGQLYFYALHRQPESQSCGAHHIQVCQFPVHSRSQTLRLLDTTYAWKALYLVYCSRLLGRAPTNAHKARYTSGHPPYLCQLFSSHSRLFRAPWSPKLTLGAKPNLSQLLLVRRWLQRGFVSTMGLHAERTVSDSRDVQKQSLGLGSLRQARCKCKPGHLLAASDNGSD